MPRDTRADPRPYGVPLDMVIAALPEAAKARQRGESLVVQHSNFTTRLDVVQPPADYKSGSGSIKAIVQIRSDVPDVVSTMLKSPTISVTMNTFATVGAVTQEDGKIFVGSRVTLYADDEQAWNAYFPVIVFALTGGTTSLFGAIRRSFTNEHGVNSKSSWTEREFKWTCDQLSNFCVCTTDGLGLTAEFGLRDGAVSASQGDPTALLQISADQPHPELGGGLFCLLQMPHDLPDQEHLDQTLTKLNRMEMEPYDLAPHFGAWCRGQGNNPAYVSFVPNGLHAKGMMLNLSLWAAVRAKRGSDLLAALGISL